MATKNDTKDNPWGNDNWDDFNDDKEKPSQQDDHKDRKAKEGKTLTEKLGDGLHRTKEGASKSMRKVRDGASIGLFWMKDKLHRPAATKPPPNPPPPPPPPTSSP